MFIKRFAVICSLPFVLTSCAEFSGSQPPAPVYRSESTVYQPPAAAYPAPSTEAKPETKYNTETEIVETQPLQESTQITESVVAIEPEPTLLTPEEEQALLSLEPPKDNAAPQPPVANPATDAITPPATTTAPTDATATPDATKNQPPVPPVVVKPEPIIPPAPPPPPPPPPPMAFAPLENFPPLSPVVGALVVAANKNTAKGQIETATTTIERAIRIEPRNATLFYKLAVLRLKQAKPSLAEDLARKSALLASNDSSLKKHSWLLIAKARDMQKNYQGAKEAKAKADKF